MFVKINMYDYIVSEERGMRYKKSRVLLVITLIALIVGGAYFVKAQNEKAQIINQEKLAQAEAARIEQERQILEKEKAE